MGYADGMNAMTGAIQGGLRIRGDRRAQDKHDMDVAAYRAAVAEAGQGGPAPAGASPDGQAPVAAGLPAPSLPRAGRGSYADMMAAAAAYGNGQYTAGANIRSAVEERRKTEEFNGLYADAASQIAKLSDEDRDNLIHKAVNTTGGIPGVLWQSKDKSGYMVMLTDPKTGRPVATGDDGMPYSAFLDKARADQILTYGLLAQMNPSYAQTAHAKLAELHNTLYERGERLDTRETAAVQTQNQAVRFGHQNEHDAAMLEQRKREVGNQAGHYRFLQEQERSRFTPNGLGYVLDEKGGMVPASVGVVSNSKGGSEIRVMRFDGQDYGGSGFVSEQQLQAAQRQASEEAKLMDGRPMLDANGRQVIHVIDNKRVPATYTAETAYGPLLQQKLDILRRKGGSGGAGSPPPITVTPEAVRILNGAGAGGAKPAGLPAPISSAERLRAISASVRASDAAAAAEQAARQREMALRARAGAVNSAAPITEDDLRYLPR